MLDLPPSTDVRKAIPKDAFFSSKNIKGREKERFDKQVHSITIRSIISPDSVNIDKGKNVSAIYVMELQLNVQDCDDGNLMLLNRLGHKTVYVLSYGDVSKIAVVEDIVFQTDWKPNADHILELEGLDLDTVWANIVKGLGNLPRDEPLHEAIAWEKRTRSYNTQIADLEKKFQKEKQNHERRRIHSEIQRLKKERDTKPEPVKTETPQQPVDTESKPTKRRGVSVTRRISEVDQPPGGFINPRLLNETRFDDGKTLGEENVPPAIAGLAVDYLTRWVMGSSLSEAFIISVMGGFAGGKAEDVAEHMCGIRGLDDDSIECACRTCMYDSYYRARRAPKTDPFLTFVDHQTCENIRIMIERSKRFFDVYGPITESGPKFPGAYTEVVGAGDGDYLTESTIWDFKVSKNIPTKEHTLQLAMYYIMGKHSTDSHFDTVRNIGIFNPRLNIVYALDMSKVPKETMRRIEIKVIGYEESECIEW